MKRLVIATAATLGLGFNSAAGMTIDRSAELLEKAQQCDRAHPFNTRCADYALRGYQSCINNRLKDALDISIRDSSSDRFDAYKIICTADIPTLEFFVKKYTDPKIGKRVQEKYFQVTTDMKAAINQHALKIAHYQTILDEVLKQDEEYTPKGGNVDGYHFAIAGSGFSTRHTIGHGKNKREAEMMALKRCEPIAERKRGLTSCNVESAPFESDMCIAIATSKSTFRQYMTVSTRQNIYNLASTICSDCRYSGVIAGPRSPIVYCSNDIR